MSKKPFKFNPKVCHKCEQRERERERERETNSRYSFIGKCCEKVFQSILGKNKAQNGCFIIGLHLFAFGIFTHNDSKNLLKFNFIMMN